MDVDQSTMQRTGTQPLVALSGEICIKDRRRTHLHIMDNILMHLYLPRVYHMKPTGFEVISEQDCKELHYMYADEKKK